MDKEKLNPLVRKIAEDLMSVRTGLPLASAVASANYKLSNIASQMHIRVDTKSGYQPTPVNTYTLTLLNSGGGKNSSLGLLDRYYFSDAFNKIRDTIYPYYKKDALAKLEENDIDRELHSWTQSISNATISGMYAYAESFSLVGFGSLNIEVDEIGNAVTSKAELFENLLTPYDNGDFMPVAKRTDANAMDINGLPVNLYSFGNKVRLLNGDNVERDFIKLIDEGYGRRFIFVDDNSVPKPKTPQEILNEMDMSEQIRADREPDREKIVSVLNGKNFKKILSMNREAMLAYATIKSESDLYISENKNLQPAVVADISERHFKTVKLAGVYAFFEGSDTVTSDNIYQAFEVIKESSKTLMELRRLKPLQERLLEALLLEPKPITAQTMLGYSFINSTWTKKVNEFIDLAKQLASELGYEWDEHTKSGVTYYSVMDKSEQLDVSLI
jgi:hypothetical protein